MPKHVTIKPELYYFCCFNGALNAKTLKH